MRVFVITKNKASYQPFVEDFVPPCSEGDGVVLCMLGSDSSPCESCLGLASSGFFSGACYADTSNYCKEGLCPSMSSNYSLLSSLRCSIKRFNEGGDALSSFLCNLSIFLLAVAVILFIISLVGYFTNRYFVTSCILSCFSAAALLAASIILCKI